MGEIFGKFLEEFSGIFGGIFREFWEKFRGILVIFGGIFFIFLVFWDFGVALTEFWGFGWDFGEIWVDFGEILGFLGDFSVVGFGFLGFWGRLDRILGSWVGFWGDLGWILGGLDRLLRQLLISDNNQILGVQKHLGVSKIFWRVLKKF